MNLSLSSRIANGYGSNNGANVSATVNQGAQSVSGNYTDITYSMSATYFCNAGWTWGGATRTNCGWFDLLINGVTVATIGLSVVAGWGNGTSIGTKSGTYRVTHNADGTKSVSVQIRINSGTDPLNGGVYYQAATGGAQTLTLSTIPRTSKVSLDKSSLECNGSNKFTIKTNRASGSFTHTITYGFGSTSGTIATGVGDSCTWTPGKSLLSQIPNAQSGWGTITCKTYSGSTLIGQSTVDFTLTVGSTSKPSLSGLTIAEQTSIVSQKAGSNATMALLSVKRVTVNASAKDGASVSSVKVANNGKSVTLSKSGSQYYGSISSVTSGTYTVTVTDSRGLTTSQEVKQTFYNYTRPTIESVSFTRATQTGDEGSLKASGKYANLLSNTVTIQVTRTGLSAATITGSKNSGSWNFSKSYTDLIYTNSYTATIKITDSFGQVAQLNVVLARSQPVLWIGKTKAKVNGMDLFGEQKSSIPEGSDLNDYKTTGVYHQSTDAGAQNGLNYPTNHAGVLIVYGNSNMTFQQYQSYYDDTLWTRRWYNWGKNWSSWKLANINAVYPVGSIYMSVNSTNPGTLFGGTWQRIEGRFLLGASSTYGAGSTGGEASHTLTTNEMPNHVHDASNGVGSHFITDGRESGYGSARLSQGGGAFVLSGLMTTGGGWSHNNMPPYLSVYIWKRTA